MVRNLIMGHDQKQSPFHMIMTPYSSLMEIKNRTLTKMKFLLNDYGVWVSRTKLGFMLRKNNNVVVVMMSLK
jgi:hypothetical protein